MAGDARRLPVLYVSGTQINAMALTYASTGSVDSIRVVYNGQYGQPFRVVPIGEQPQVFRSTIGKAAALNEDGTINSADNAAKLGSIVTIFANNGTNASARSRRRRGMTAFASFALCAITLGPYLARATVTYAGSAPGLVDAIASVNFRLASGSRRVSC